MSEEWSEWIAYTGDGRLHGVELGMTVQIRGKVDGEFIVSPPQVVTEPIMFSHIVVGDNEELHAHRIRKPKGLSILQRIAQHPHKERIEA